MHWQQDVSGNVAAYYQIRKITVTAAGSSLTIDSSQADTFLIPIINAITSMTITNPIDGQEITLMWQQDSTGHAVTVASNLDMGTLTVTTTANKVTIARFSYNAGNTTWYIVGQNNL